MNSYRYDVKKRKQWVLEKVTRLKTVRQILMEASITRATLYNWIDEFKGDKDFEREAENFRKPPAEKIIKTSKPELLNQVLASSEEKYQMLLSSIATIDKNQSFSKRLVAVLIKRYTLTVAQACAIAGVTEDFYGYKPRKPEVEDYLVYEALVKLIHEDKTIIFNNLCNLCLEKNKGWTRKQIKRVYRDGMVYLERTRKNSSEQKAKNKTVFATNRIQRPGAMWVLGLMNIEQRTALYIVDEENLHLLNAQTFSSSLTLNHLLSFLEQCVVENGQPKRMKLPNIAAFSSREIIRWSWQHKMALVTISLQKEENEIYFKVLEEKIQPELISNFL
jgi:hypothetical protein